MIFLSFSSIRLKLTMVIVSLVLPIIAVARRVTTNEVINVADKSKLQKILSEKDSFLLRDERICLYPSLIDIMFQKTLDGEIIQKMCKHLPKSSTRKKSPIRSRMRRKSRRINRQKNHDLTQKARKKLNNLLKSTRCRPMRQFVEVENPNPHREYFIPCKVPVKKCSGCCQSQLMECVATRTKMKKFDVIKLSVNHKQSTTGRPFQKIKVSEDRACECRCKVKKTDCGPGQIYDPDNCHCRCPTESYKTCHHKKVWSEPHCSCVCKEKIDCTTGLNFNRSTCECEMTVLFEDTIYEESSFKL